ncbi:hypothetical protein PAXRUDRAFT_520257 [Paxillus rubicundulus Ve08.2h10]|uniref:Uncharacterized protein n=1 Tax=Paxillus rubicundulus Ve08.2h10 TaxID=930991 RepID=A0A0D0BTS2_9AGAM|nr:hypothetical protein PAXRUDRAFT_520257 [Paxillus rubicundulus Ve08.2h10]
MWTRRMERKGTQKKGILVHCEEGSEAHRGRTVAHSVPITIDVLCCLEVRYPIVTLHEAWRKSFIAMAGEDGRNLKTCEDKYESTPYLMMIMDVASVISFDRPRGASCAESI